MDYRELSAAGGCICLFMVLIPSFYWLTEVARTDNNAELAIAMFTFILLLTAAMGAYILWKHIEKTRNYGSKDHTFDPEDPPPPYSEVAIAPPPYDFCAQSSPDLEVVQSHTGI